MRSVRGGLVFGWLAASALAATLVASPQQGGAPLPLLGVTAGTFKSAIDLVTLNVTVTDTRNKVVAGLGRDDFQVLEDGVAQDVSFFAASEVPIDVALLVDSSSSMRDKMPVVQEAAAGFVKALRPADRASVMSFSTQLRIVQPFTSDQAALNAAIRSIAARGSTSLYTALYIALDQFQRAPRDQPVAAEGVRRLAIVVLTDGEDTSSLIQFSDLLDRARRAGVAIYPISIIGGSEAAALSEAGEKRFSNLSDYSLKTLAQETGAQAFFPMQLADLSGVYRLVADELSTQYALGFLPKLDRKDGSYRRLAVRIVSRPDARSRTRTGYYSAGPVRAANTRQAP